VVSLCCSLQIWLESGSGGRVNRPMEAKLFAENKKQG